MRDDDLDFDLSAWEAPAPPAGIADAVVGRMREAVAASPVTQLIQAPSRRRWWIAAAAIGVAGAAAVAILLFGSKRADEGHGSIAASRAQHVELGGVAGDLDPGVELTWDRDADGLRVVQRRGSATWKVSGDDHLVIDAGATVASVEASGASLRVEVQMNQSDARLIGVSGVTAAAVALVTVVVYEGHIKAGSGGQATIVAAGDTWKSPEPATVGATMPGDLVVACLKAKADRKWQDLENCAKRLGDPKLADEYAKVAISEARAELALQGVRDAVKQRDAVAAERSADTIPDDSVYKEEANELIASISPCDSDALRTKGTEYVNMGQYAAGLAQFLEAHKCKPNDPAITRLGYLAACQAGDAARAKELYAEIPVTQQGAIAPICLRNNIDVLASPTTVDSCNAGKLRDDGIAAEKTGDLTRALDAFEASIRCKHDDTVVLRAYFTACNAKNAAKAREHFDDLSSWDQAIVAPYCDPVVALHPSATNADTCIPATLNALGIEYIQHGQYRAALAPLQKSLTCKGGDTVQTLKLAYMAACDANDANAARTLYARIPSPGSIAQICLRNHIDPTASSASSSPAKCDADALRVKATALVNQAHYGAAVAAFKQAIACRPDPRVIRLAYIAACQAGDAATAKAMYAQIPVTQQGNLLQICLRNRIDPSAPSTVNDASSSKPSPKCDAEALRTRGTELVNMGQYGAGLAQYKEALKCRYDPALVRLAYLAACQAGEAATAKAMFAQIPASQQGNLAGICLRNKIDVQ